MHAKSQGFEERCPPKQRLLHVFHQVGANVGQTWRHDGRKGRGREVPYLPEIVSANVGVFVQRVETPNRGWVTADHDHRRRPIPKHSPLQVNHASRNWPQMMFMP